MEISLVSAPPTGRAGHRAPGVTCVVATAPTSPTKSSAFTTAPRYVLQRGSASRRSRLASSGTRVATEPFWPGVGRPYGRASRCPLRLGQRCTTTWVTRRMHVGPGKILLSWSTGGPAWALHVLRQQLRLATASHDHERAFDRVASVVRRGCSSPGRVTGLLLTVVPLPWPCSNEEYERRMADSVAARGGRTTHAAFGDLFPGGRSAIAKRLAGSGLSRSCCGRRRPPRHSRAR